MDEACRSHFGSGGRQDAYEQVNDKLRGEVYTQCAQDVPQVAEELFPVAVPEQPDQPEHNEQDQYRPDGEREENPERTFIAFNAARDLSVEHAGVQDAVNCHRQHERQHEEGDSFRKGIPAAGVTKGEEKRNQGGKGD